MRLGSRKIALTLACLACVAVGAVEAAKLKVKNLPIDFFPGVNDDGDLDFFDYDGLVKLSINLKNGKTTVKGKASVDNFFRKRVVFKNEDLAGIGELIKDKYVVAKNGKATYTGRYIVDL